MHKAKDVFFEGLDGKLERRFGGSLLRSHPKGARTLATKSAIHLVLKSSQAKGEYSFLLKSQKINKIIRKQGQRFGIKIYKIANAGNHLHVLIQISNRYMYPGFIRAITGLIVRAATGSGRGHALRERFWDFRPFTRIVSWGREFMSLVRYLKVNSIETELNLERKESKWLLSKVEEITRRTRLEALGFS